MVQVGTLALILGGLSGAASAGPFTPKTMQGSLPETEVERALVLPKGWLEVGLSVDGESSVSYRGSDGVEREQPGGFGWTYSRMWLDIRQGFSPRISLYARVPWVRASLQPVIGRPTTTVAMGDAHTGVVYQPKPASPHSLAFSVDLKAPSGVEWPTGTGSAGDTQSFLTGTGLTNLGLFSHGKVVLGRVASAEIDVGYVRKFPGVVGYVVEVGGFGSGVLNAGDELDARGHLTGQMGSMLWLRAGLDYRYLTETWVGVNGPLGGRIMRPVRHSSGSWMTGEAVFGVDPTDKWTIEMRVRRDLMGGDSRPFAHLGLEELSPQPGLGLGLGVVSRW